MSLTISIAAIIISARHFPAGGDPQRLPLPRPFVLLKLITLTHISAFKMFGVSSTRDYAAVRMTFAGRA
jgi:hypothetical protein